MALDKLLVHLRTVQLFYHNCHNTVKGPTFHGDHKLFGAFYTEAEENYDSVAERFIGLMGVEAFDGAKVAAEASVFLTQLPPLSEPKNMFKAGLALEQKLVAVCNECDKDPRYSSGTRALVGDIANAAEARVYKIKQRIK